MAGSGNCFVALLPDAATRDRLAAVQERLRRWELPAAWTHPEDLHLTVCFLGAMDDAEADWLPAALGPLAEALELPADLRLAGLVPLGGRDAPGAVACAVDDPAARCAAIHADCCAALDAAAQRAYRPHLTLARPHGPAPAELPLFRDWPHLIEAHAGADWGPCGIERIAILHRRDRGSAARCAVLAAWP